MVAACPFPSPRGSQVLIRELAQALAERGHVVHLVTYPFGERLAPVRGILIHRIRAPKFPFKFAAFWGKLVLDVMLAVELYRVVRREGVQLIHAHNYEGPMIGYVVRWLTGVPVVYHSHNALSDELGYYFTPGLRRIAARSVGRLLDALIPRRADFSIALTKELADFLRTRGVRPLQLAIVPPAASALPAADSSGRELGVSGSRFVVMYSGNLDAYQDLEVLYEAFQAFQRDANPALLVLVTHEATWQERASARLKVLLEEGHARVVVAPAFSVVRRLLGRADVLVCPRSSWSGFPIKLLNYMAAGRPVVAAQGSAKNIVHEQTGLIFRNGDAQDLKGALQRLFTDEDLRRQLGENARVAAATLYNWKRAISQIEEVYAALPALARQQRSDGGPLQSQGAGIDSAIERSYKRRISTRRK